MNSILPEGKNDSYYVGGKVSPSHFKGHAGRAARRQLYHGAYMFNGVSLHELSVSLSKGRKSSERQSDGLCSICSDGGERLLCDTCPRAFQRMSTKKNDIMLIKKKLAEKCLNEDGDLNIQCRILREKSSEDSKLVLSKVSAFFHALPQGAWCCSIPLREIQFIW